MSEDSNRLRTFEVDDDEVLHIAAGRGEMDNRTIFNGEASGRWAVVNVDELTAAPDYTQPEYEQTLNFDDMSIVGGAFALPPSGGFSYAIIGNGGDVVKRLTDPGVYHALRIPFRRN